MIFLVFCDLKNESRRQSYDKLFGEMSRLEAHQVGEHYWLLRSNSSADEIAKKLWALADLEDCIFVSALSTSYRYVNAEDGTTDWLRRFLTQNESISAPPDLYKTQRRQAPVSKGAA